MRLKHQTGEVSLIVEHNNHREINTKPINFSKLVFR